MPVAVARCVLALVLLIGCGSAGGPVARRPPTIELQPAASGSVARRKPAEDLPPKIAKVARGAEGVRVTASSSYPGWPPEHATDGKLETSWFSAQNDSASRGGTPFVELELDQPRALQRVVVFGNRDPEFPRGYSIEEGRLELFDATGLRQLATSGTGQGPNLDFDFRLPRRLEGIKRIRFSSTRDQGHKNAHGDVAIAEMLIE